MSLAHLVPGNVVLWVWMKDQQGRNPKFRPVVILAVNAARTQAIACAVTHTRPAKIPPEYVPLSWNSRGTTSTRLYQPSWAVASWLARGLGNADIRIEKIGRLSSKEMNALLAKVKQHAANSGVI